MISSTVLGSINSQPCDGSAFPTMACEGQRSHSPSCELGDVTVWRWEEPEDRLSLSLAVSMLATAILACTRASGSGRTRA